MSTIVRSLVMMIALLVSGNALSMDFTVEALFTGKAMIKLDGKRVLLKAGQEKNGLTLISTDTYKQTAVIEINGSQETYELGRHIGGGYAKVTSKEILVTADNRGSYFTNGQINGRTVNFLVDTGASAVAMNETLARGLRLEYVDEENKTLVETAGGNQIGYRVTLKEVSIGGIVLKNIDAIVIEGKSPAIPLLGMSFLGQLEIEHKRNLMVLRKKY